jgi:hypothetical protein
MYALIALIAISLLLLILRNKENFEVRSDMVDISEMPDQANRTEEQQAQYAAELQRIWNMTPVQLRTTDNLAESMESIAQIIIKYYTVFKSATTVPTQEEILFWVTDNYPTNQESIANLITAYFYSAENTGTTAAAESTQTRVEAPEPVTPPTVETPTSTSDYESVLNLYRTNFLEYKLTGKTPYKTAYESAQAWLDKYIQTLDAEGQEKAQYIKAFVDEYADTNKDLVSLQKNIQNVRKTAPGIQDQYELVTRIDDVPESFDMSQVYYKGAIVVAAIGIAFALGR